MAQEACSCVCTFIMHFWTPESPEAVQRGAQTAAQICQQSKVMHDLPGDLLWNVLWRWVERLPQGPCT